MLNPGEILSINNLGDRGNLDNDFPRSAIIIGSRISTENINENSNENSIFEISYFRKYYIYLGNEEEQEESNNQIINESTPLLDHNSGNNLTNNEQNQIKEEEEEINKQKKPEIAKIGIEEEILNEKIEEKVKQTEDPLKTEEKQDFNLDKENIINIENSENNFEKLEQEKNSNE